jgi:hypothetical protein
VSGQVRDSVEVSVRGEQKAQRSRGWSTVADVARAQWGVISLEQLLEIGFSLGEVRGLVGRGFLVPLHRGVYAVGQLPQLTKGYLKAALLAVGCQAFLSHRTAAAVYGLREVSTRRIDVTVPARCRRSRGSLRLHRTTIEPDTQIRNGLPVSSFPQMLIELASQETSRELQRLITWGIRKSYLNLDEMRQALARNGRRAGLRKLRAALAAYLPTEDRKSDLERDFDAWLAEQPEIPQPKRNIHIDGWEIDCYWPQYKLAVELDGRPYHIAAGDMEKDRVKDGKLLIIGIRTLRITDTRFNHDRTGVYEDLIAALGLR